MQVKPLFKVLKKSGQQAYMQGFRENGKEFAQQAFNDVVKKGPRKSIFRQRGVTGVADAGVAFGHDIIQQATEIDASLGVLRFLSNSIFCSRFWFRNKLRNVSYSIRKEKQIYLECIKKLDELV